MFAPRAIGLNTNVIDYQLIVFFAQMIFFPVCLREKEISHEPVFCV